jgi:hypothetical protein
VLNMVSTFLLNHHVMTLCLDWEDSLGEPILTCTICQICLRSATLWALIMSMPSVTYHCTVLDSKATQQAIAGM